jgi:putative oxidoreductase
MMVAAFVVHLPMDFFGTDKGFAYPLRWGIAALFFLIRGSGPLSVDRAIGREF